MREPPGASGARRRCLGAALVALGAVVLLQAGALTHDRAVTLLGLFAALVAVLGAVVGAVVGAASRLVRLVVAPPITIETRRAEAAPVLREEARALSRRLRDGRVREGPHQHVVEGRHRGEPVTVTFDGSPPGGALISVRCAVPLTRVGRLLPGLPIPPSLVEVAREAGAPVGRLLGASRWIDIGLRSVEASTELSRADELERALDALLLLARVVRRDAPPAPEAPPPEVRVVDARDLAGPGEVTRCPYCHADVREGAPDAATCAACRSPHHAACFQEHGGCSVTGCAGKTGARDRRTRAR